MSNKEEFYLLCSKGITEKALRDFVSTHPGVLWRKVGKTDYQVSFRRQEGWLNVDSFMTNYMSQMSKNLIDQAQKVRTISNQCEVWRLVSFRQEYSAKDVIEAFKLEEIINAAYDEESRRWRQRVKDLNAEVDGKGVEIAKLQKELDKLRAVIKLRESCVAKQLQFIKDNVGFTGLSKEECRRLFDLIQKPYKSDT